MKIKNFIFCKKNLLVIILVVAAVLRLWRLGSIPPSLTSDEAALGYNSYSIFKTGRDEYGKFLPVIFKSFGDYKPGLYVYLDVPFIATLGLNEFSTRLPSALCGILSIYLIYLISKKLFGEKIGITSAFIAAIMPWFIYFSRGAWEVNVCLTLTLAGIYFYLESFKKPKLLILSLPLFALTLITYQGAKLSTAIAFLVLIIAYWRQSVSLVKNIKTVAISVFISLIIAFPIILSFFNGQTGRLDIFNVFSYPRPKDYLQNFLDEGREKVGTLSYYLYHSESLNFFRGITGRWFNHFSGRFLFFEGDWSNPRQSAPYQGMLLISDIIILPIGLFVLARKKFESSVVFVWLWLILACLPAALSRDEVHAVRSINMSIPLIMILSLGLSEIMNKVAGLKKIKIFSYVAVVVIYFVGFSYFLDAYFIHVPAHDSDLWNYGFREIVETVAPIQGNYKKILVQQSFAQPYIYFLYYLKYDPAKYQKTANLKPSEYTGDVGYITKLDNIEFGPIDWSVDRGDHGVLIVGDPIRIPDKDSSDTSQFKLIKEIKYLNGRDVAFKIIEVL